MRTLAYGPVAVADVAGSRVVHPGARCATATAGAQTSGGRVPPLIRSVHRRIRFAIDAVSSQPFPSVRFCARSSNYACSSTSGIILSTKIPNVGYFLSALGWVERRRPVVQCACLAQTRVQRSSSNNNNNQQELPTAQLYGVSDYPFPFKWVCGPQ